MGWFGSSKKQVRITEGPWDFYVYPYGEDQRASITFDVRADAEPEHRGYDACRRVIIYLPHDRVYANGLPMAAEYQRSTEDEQSLIAELERAAVDCKKVGHMLYGAMRDIVFQVEDAAGFSSVYERWRATRPQRKIELVERAGWSFFDDKVRPKPVHRKWIQNNHVIIELLKAGSDRQQPHSLDHTFLGAADTLNVVARELGAAGFQSRRSEPSSLTIVQELPLDCDEITTWTLRFEALAENCGASYDGWGAAVIR
jgi:regulator of RNase E activity RraB